jgi:hypothetical protein
MRISDIILERIVETKLYEMAREFQRAMDNVRNHSDTLVEHIVKTLMYGKVEYYPKWIHELDTYCENILDSADKYKRKKKRTIERDTFYKIFHDETVPSMQDLESIVKRIHKKSTNNALKRNLQPLKVIQDHRVIHAQLLDILSTVSDLLSKDEVPDFDAIIGKYL